MKTTAKLGLIAILLAGQSLPLPKTAAPPAQANQGSNRLRALSSAVQVITDTTFGTTRRSSGFLFTSSGFVATTYHAVSDAKRITVLHSDHGIFEVGGLRRVDPRSDIVVLMLSNAQNMSISCAPFGRSTEVKPGDLINVVHHPATQDEALTRTKVLDTGYPSQLRQTPLVRKYASDMLMLEIGGSYDSGSAGGLVCNENYEVVGIVIGGNGDQEGDGSQGAFVLSSYYLEKLIRTNSKLGLSSLQSGHTSDASYFDTFLGPAPQRLPYKDPMPEGFLLWFAPTHQFSFENPVFSHEVNDKIDKTWFRTANLVIDKRPLREWSASRIFIWDAADNPWGITDAKDRFVHFDADSTFSKLIYKNRDTEERIMTRHILAMPLDPGKHLIQYQNIGANFKSTGTKRRRFEVASGTLELIDIDGLSLVSMQLLEQPESKVGESEPVKYELERHMVGKREINSALRSSRFKLD